MFTFDHEDTEYCIVLSKIISVSRLLDVLAITLEHVGKVTFEFTDETEASQLFDLLTQALLEHYV